MVSRGANGSAKQHEVLMGNLHQQTSLTTGTIAYNDKLSTDFRHVFDLGMEVLRRARGSGKTLEGWWFREWADGEWEME